MGGETPREEMGRGEYKRMRYRNEAMFMLVLLMYFVIISQTTQAQPDCQERRREGRQPQKPIGRGNLHGLPFPRGL